MHYLYVRVKKIIRIIINIIIRMIIYTFVKCMPIVFESYKVHRGYELKKRVKEKYGKNVFLFFLRGATGDVYLTNCLVQEYIKEHGISEYVFIGDGKSLEEISELFGTINVVQFSRWNASCFQSYYKFWGHMVGDVLDTFLWQHTMYFNRCRVRMLEEFNFMDTYQWYVFGFPDRKAIRLPQFAKVTPELINKWSQMGIVGGKTVIISNKAYSVTGLSGKIWKKICHELNGKGWETLFCVNPRNELPPFCNAKTVWFTYKESAALLEYAGAFLSIRNGLCDIISSAKCKKTILYPYELKSVNYSEHRSDLKFCGLVAMGLNSEAVEIETKLLSNIALQDRKYVYEWDQSDVDKLIKQISMSFD